MMKLRHLPAFSIFEALVACMGNWSAGLSRVNVLFGPERTEMFMKRRDQVEQELTLMFSFSQVVSVTQV